VNAAHYENSVPGLRRRLRPWLPKRGQRVLDLGCGLGELLYLCQQCGCRETVGVNLCAEEIEAARPFVQSRLECVDILDYLRGTRDSFDCIFALNILEHLGKDTLLEVLRLCSARLVLGGTFVAIVPNAISPFGTVTRFWDFTHEWAFAPNNFRQLAPLSGFSELEFRECGPLPHGVVSGTRWLLWQFVRLVIRGFFLVEVADAKGGIYTMDMMVRMVKRA